MISNWHLSYQIALLRAGPGAFSFTLKSDAAPDWFDTFSGNNLNGDKWPQVNTVSFVVHLLLFVVIYCYLFCDYC